MAGRRDDRVWFLLLLMAAVACLGLVYALTNGGAGGGGSGPQGPSARAGAPRGHGDGGPPRAAPRPPSERPDTQRPEPEPPPPAAEPGPDPEPQPDDEPPTPDELAAPAELILELLELPAEPEREITVLVTDPFGDPISGALVVFREGARLLYRERTDIAGVAVFLPYRFEEGPFRIDALAPGYVTASAPEVAPGADIRLVMKARSIIEGVVEAPGAGQGTVVLLTGEGRLEMPLGPDNTFRFVNLDEGYVTVRAEIEPFGVAQQSFYLDGGVLRYVELELDVKNRTAVAGKLVLWPGEGGCWINGRSVPVTAIGTFEFDEAVEGVNEIFVDAPGRALFRERFSTLGREANKLRFRLLKEETIQGRAIDAETRRPLAGALVRLGVEFDDALNDRVPLFPVENVPVVRTDDRGRFEIERLDPRLVYLVSIVAEGHGQALERVVPGPGVRRIAVPPGPFLFGRLRGFGGVPRDAVVTATRLEETPSSRRFNVEGYDDSRSGRDGDGFYGLDGLLPGVYHLRVDAPGFGSVETVVDLQDGRRGRLDLRLREGLDVEQDELELLRRLPPAAARVPEESPPSDFTVLQVDARPGNDRAPLPGVKVRFFRNEAEFTAPMLYSVAEFELYGLPEGDYRAVLTHPSLDRPRVFDDLRLRRAEPLQLRLFR